MTPDQKDRRNAWIGAIGVLLLLCTASWFDGASKVADVHASAKPATPTVRPFSDRMGCQPWREGLSRSVMIIATEDETGALVGVQCMRVKERGKVGVM